MVTTEFACYDKQFYLSGSILCTLRILWIFVSTCMNSCLWLEFRIVTISLVTLKYMICDYFENHLFHSTHTFKMNKLCTTDTTVDPGSNVYWHHGNFSSYIMIPDLTTMESWSQKDRAVLRGTWQVHNQVRRSSWNVSFTDHLRNSWQKYFLCLGERANLKPHFILLGENTFDSTYKFGIFIATKDFGFLQS